MSNPGPAITNTYEAFYPIGNVPKFGAFLITLSPAIVATITTAAQNFAATGIGLTVGDIVSVSFQGAQTVGVGILDAYVSASDQLTVRFVNPTAAGVTPASGTYAVTVFRPTSSVSATVPQMSW